jgi:hypothetical protein
MRRRDPILVLLSGVASPPVGREVELGAGTGVTVRLTRQTRL